MTNIKKLCVVCSKEFYVFPNAQNRKQKYCARACYLIGSRGHKHSPGSIEKMRKSKMGHGWPEGFSERQSAAQKERFKTDSPWNKGLDFGNAKWFHGGNPNAYRALHKRIARKFGTPSVCEHCGRGDLKRYEWANKSGNYLEERGDWLRLCKSCHIKYDGVNRTKSSFED